MNVLAQFIFLSVIVSIVAGSVSGVVAIFWLRRQKQTVLYLEKKYQRLQNSLSALEHQLEKFKDSEKRDESPFAREEFEIRTEAESPVSESPNAAVPQKPEQEEQKPVVEKIPSESTIETSVSPPAVEAATASIQAPKPSHSTTPPAAVPPGSIKSEDESEFPKTSEPEMDLETRIGAVWFNRIGLVGLLIGFGLLGRLFEFQAWHKTAAAFVSSAALFAVGWIYERKLQRFARPVQAGGLALAFFSSYASHFLNPMACTSLGVSLTLMTASVFAILFCAERWESESTAMMAVFFGHTAAFTAGGGADSFSLIAITFLCLTSLGLMVRHNWLPLGLFSVCAAFLSHSAWSLLDHAPSTPEASFWVNFSFLSSYYFIFLCADLIYQHRLWKQGSDEYSTKHQTSGRLLGPASIVLYASTASGLFYATAIYWNAIYLFFIPLAALHAALVAYHQSRGNRDYPLYAVFSTTFFTLGLFSCIGGLSLNMALAAEALVLLLASRKMQLWYLGPLAQVALSINFLHFWMSGTVAIKTWPEYLGCTVAAFVYFVKSHLEETWRFDNEEETLERPLWVNTLRAIHTKMMTPFAYLHAFAGATLISFQAACFFHTPWVETVVALAIALSTVAVIRLKSKALIPAIWWTVFIAAALWLTAMDRNVALKDWSETWRWFGWLVQNTNLFTILACAWLAFYFAGRQRRAILYVFGVGMLLLSLSMVFFSLRPTQSHYLVLPIWAIPPLSLWFFSVYTERLKRVDEWEWSGCLWGYLERAGIKNISGVAAIVAIVGAFATHYVFLSTWPIETEAYWTLSAIALLIAAYAALKNKTSVIPGLLVLVCLYANAHIFSLINENAGDSHLLTWWLTASSVITAGVMLLGAFRTKRGSFVAASLILAGVTLETAVMVLLNQLTDFSPYIAWLAVPIGLWVVAETLRTTIGGKLKDTIVWNDSFDFTSLRNEGSILIHALSLVTAFLLFMITVRYMESPSFTLWLVALYAVLLSAFAYLRRSTVIAIGTPLLILCAHLFYFAKIHPAAGAREHVLLNVALVALTVALSGFAEKLIASRKLSQSETIESYAYAGTAFYYLLAFFLGGVFTHCRSLIDLNGTAWIFPYQIAFPLLVFTVGWFFRLGLMQSIAYGFTLVWLLPKAAERFITRADYQTNLLGAGVILFLALIYMERIFWRQKDAPVSVLTIDLMMWMRKIAIFAAGILMLLVLTLSEELRGYWTTFGWSLLAFLMVSLGFLWKDKTYRRTALAIFSLSIVRIVAIDVAQLEALYRTIAFLCLGACLIAVSFLYSRFGKEIRRWL